MASSKPKPRLILASGSAARAAMLQNAGLKFDIIPASIDESILQNQKIAAADIAQELSKTKALHVAKNHVNALVIGADQVLEFEGEIINKAQNRDEVIEKLRRLKGKPHRLISAVTIAKGELVLWQSYDEAVLNMRDFDDVFLHDYLTRASDALMHAVGGYELESHGSWLFDRVEGDYFTILGMPLLPLLGYLKDNHGYGP